MTKAFIDGQDWPILEANEAGLIVLRDAVNKALAGQTERDGMVRAQFEDADGYTTSLAIRMIP